ncbi:hypothetical protein BM536_010885 [Streptomyces phaeoluteigriseus]|uniref:Uncharacterized protein n=1 Tax=Streptomyces phaeoluteigriseus TaxID=114686 RepID=A0A1V6MW99_9ACTN|nr:hypothetical protein BM536_010885 [Streptomyces phaeoluteigriseus]
MVGLVVSPGEVLVGVETGSPVARCATTGLGAFPGIPAPDAGAVLEVGAARDVGSALDAGAVLEVGAAPEAGPGAGVGLAVGVPGGTGEGDAGVIPLVTSAGVTGVASRRARRSHVVR